MVPGVRLGISMGELPLKLPAMYTFAPGGVVRTVRVAVWGSGSGSGGCNGCLKVASGQLDRDH